MFYFKLEQDFEILHPEHGLKLYIAWPKLSEFITDRVNFKAKKRLDNVLTPGKILIMSHFTVILCSDFIFNLFCNIFIYILCCYYDMYIL